MGSMVLDTPGEIDVTRVTPPQRCAPCGGGSDLGINILNTYGLPWPEAEQVSVKVHGHALLHVPQKQLRRPIKRLRDTITYPLCSRSRGRSRKAPHSLRASPPCFC